MGDEIDKIFDENRIPYEGVYEPNAKKGLLKLITRSHIELLRDLKKNIEYNENGQNKVINATIGRLRRELE